LRGKIRKYMAKKRVWGGGIKKTTPSMKLKEKKVSGGGKRPSKCAWWDNLTF